jgi:hypothetical protein
MPALVPLLAILTLTATAPALPQCADWTPSFGGGGFEGEVRALLEFDDGQVNVMYAGGVFLAAGDVPALRVARQKAGGWEQVGAGFDGAVNAFASVDFGAGDTLVATGEFEFSGATACRGVALWDGTSWVDLAGGLPVTPRRGEALAAFNDGSGMALYVGGDLGGTGVWRLRGGSWEPVGALDGEVLSLDVFDDGSGPALFAGGSFTGRVARWNAGAWVPLSGIVDPVLDLEVYAPTNGAPGGLFACTDGSGPGLHRLQAGSWVALPLPGAFALKRVRFHGLSQLWLGGAAELSSFDGLSVTKSVPTDGCVLAIAEVDEFPSERLWIAGRFERVAGVGAKHVASTRNVLWVATPAPKVLPATSLVNDIVEWDDGASPRSKVVIAGRIERVDGLVAHDVAAFDGLAWSVLGDFGAGSPITALATFQNTAWPASRVVAACDGRARSWDGASWTDMGNLQAGPARVASFATFDAGGAAQAQLFAIGEDLLASGSGSLAVWNGAEWIAPLPTQTLAGVGRAGVVFDPPGPLGAALYIAGRALLPGGSGSGDLVRFDGASFVSVPGAPLTLDGFTDVVVTDVLGGSPELLALSDGELHRFDGSTWTTTSVGADSTGSRLAVFDDGSGPAVYLGRHVRLRAGQFEAFAAPFDRVPRVLRALSSHSAFGECLLFGGDFTKSGSELSLGLARWSDPCAALRSYCTGKLNSAGCVPHIVWSGSASLAASSFVISAVDVLNGKSGLFYYSIWGRNSVPYQGGTLCVRSPLARTPVVHSGGNVGAPDCSGVLSLDFAPWLDGTPNPQLRVVGIVNGQWWYRDPASPSTTGLSDAIEFEIRP